MVGEKIGEHSPKQSPQPKSFPYVERIDSLICFINVVQNITSFRKVVKREYFILILEIIFGC